MISWGIPYLCLDVKLFYKAKATRPKDELDFEAVLPFLDSDQRAWLLDALGLHDPHHLDVLEHLARTYKELRLPIVPDGKGRYGRLDVVIGMPGGADIVVEIDSAPNVASAQKLAFARDAGAFPVWVRFGKGSIEEIDGVMVLDIRGVCDAGTTETASAPGGIRTPSMPSSERNRM